MPFTKIDYPINNNNAIIFTMCNCNRNRQKISNDVLKYYIETLNISKNNLYIVDSGNLGVKKFIKY